MSWQAWVVLAVVLTVGAIATVISSVDLGSGHATPTRLYTAAGLAALAAAAYVISAAIAWPA